MTRPFERQPRRGALAVTCLALVLGACGGGSTEPLAAAALPSNPIGTDTTPGAGTGNPFEIPDPETVTASIDPTTASVEPGGIEAPALASGTPDEIVYCD